MHKKLLYGLALVVVVGCSADHLAYSSVDSWHSPPPEGMKFTPLDSARFAPVADQNQSEAQAALANAAAIRVSGEEAVRLTGRHLAGGDEYVLLRGVVLNDATGAFEVGLSEGAAHVHHASLGNRPQPMRRKALIAVLQAVPEVVYVSCSMAE